MSQLRAMPLRHRVLGYLTANSPQEEQPDAEQGENAEEGAGAIGKAGASGAKSQALRLKAARIIWNPSVVAEMGQLGFLRSEQGGEQAADAKHKYQLELQELGSVSSELLRMQLAKKLRNKLFKVYQ